MMHQQMRNDDDDDEGYAKFLEGMLDEICAILGQLVLEHGEHKPIDSLIEKIEEWMGDDWYIDLSEADQKRLDEIKGWTYD